MRRSARQEGETHFYTPAWRRPCCSTAWHRAGKRTRSMIAHGWRLS